MTMQHSMLERQRYNGHRGTSTCSVQLGLNVTKGPAPPLGSGPAQQVAAVVDGGQDQTQHGDVAECSAHSFLGVCTGNKCQVISFS